MARILDCQLTVKLSLCNPRLICKFSKNVHNYNEFSSVVQYCAVDSPDSNRNSGWSALVYKASTNEFTSVRRTRIKYVANKSTEFSVEHPTIVWYTNKLVLG